MEKPLIVDPENPPSRMAAAAEEDRAADGARLPPAANQFSEFVGFLEDGDFNREMTDVLRQISAEMANAAINAGGKSKAKLSITLDFALEGRVFSISSKHKVDLPQEKRPKSVMWSTEDGRFTPNNPQQMQLFGVREVRSPGFRSA